MEVIYRKYPFYAPFINRMGIGLNHIHKSMTINYIAKFCLVSTKLAALPNKL